MTDPSFQAQLILLSVPDSPKALCLVGQQTLTASCWQATWSRASKLTECCSGLRQLKFRGHFIHEPDFTLTVAGFPAVDYFGDGSFYLLDVPGVSAWIDSYMSLTLILSLSLACIGTYLWAGTNNARYIRVHGWRLLPLRRYASAN